MQQLHIERSGTFRAEYHFEYHGIILDIIENYLIYLKGLFNSVLRDQKPQLRQNRVFQLFVYIINVHIIVIDGRAADVCLIGYLLHRDISELLFLQKLRQYGTDLLFCFLRFSADFLFCHIITGPFDMAILSEIG